MSIFRAYTQTFIDPSGTVLPNSISEMKMLPIGGVDQFVIIRGENRENPVLLILNGGPGFSETAFFRYFNSELEKKYTVVYWDQRVSGKSYNKKSTPQILSIDLYVNDICELAKHLIDSLHKDKIFLLGHSWGTLIGTMAIAKKPELFQAYIGTGQVSNMPESELESYRFTLNRATQLNHSKAIKALTAIGEPHNGYYSNGLKDTQIQRKWLTRFGGMLYGEKSGAKLIGKLFSSHEYTLYDIVQVFRAVSSKANTALSEDALLQMDLFQSIKSVEVPIYFFLGRHDYQVASIVSEQYFNILKAPSKRLVWFEKSAHNPCFEEPDKFNQLMVDMVLFENTEQVK